MSRLRDPQCRLIKTEKFIEVPTNYHRGRNSPTTNSPERYQKTLIGSSSTLEPKESLLEDITGEGIKGEGTLAEGPKDPIPEEFQEDQPLETPSPPLVLNPINTTLSLVGDPNFIDFVDPTQVKALFGTSADLVISQIETSIVEPTIPLGFNKNTVDQRKISPKKNVGTPDYHLERRLQGIFTLRIQLI